MYVGIDPVEAAAIRLAFAQFRPHMQERTIMAAAAWLRQHVEIGLRHMQPAPGRAATTGHLRTGWQWELALLAWLYEHLGIVYLLRSDAEQACALIVEAQFAAAARRQQPFTNWARGRPGCLPGFYCIGATATVPMARRIAGTCLHITDDALAAL